MGSRRSQRSVDTHRGSKATNRARFARGTPPATAPRSARTAHDSSAARPPCAAPWLAALRLGPVIALDALAAVLRDRHVAAAAPVDTRHIGLHQPPLRRRAQLGLLSDGHCVHLAGRTPTRTPARAEHADRSTAERENPANTSGFR